MVWSIFWSALADSAALLLFAAALGKLRRPKPAAVMLRRVGIAGRASGRIVERLVRLAAGGELVISVAALAAGGPVAVLLLGAAYAVLTAVAVRLALASQGVPCGCFGDSDADVGWAHVIVNGCAITACVIAALTGAPATRSFWQAGALAGTVAVAQAALLAALAYLSITALPALSAAHRRVVEAR